MVNMVTQANLLSKEDESAFFQKSCSKLFHCYSATEGSEAILVPPPCEELSWGGEAAREAKESVDEGRRNRASN